jgi:drug/metabolite transporter (DMT)-like permease
MIRAPFPTAAATRKGILLMLLGILLFTMMDALAKGLIARYPTPQVIWARFAGQALLVALILGPRLGAALRTQYPLTHLARSGFQLGATALFFASLGYIGLAEATALTDINPILITLGAALFLGERLGPRRILGVVVAMIGALIVIRPGAGVFTPAALLPLGCALSYAGNALLTRYVGQKEGPWTSLILAALFGAAVMGLAMPFVWQPIAAADIPLFMTLGILGTGAQLCVIRSFSMAEASAVAPFAYVGIVFASLWGIIFYGEYPDKFTIIGALVIVGAGIYVWHRETTAKSPHV